MELNGNFGDVVSVKRWYHVGEEEAPHLTMAELSSMTRGAGMLHRGGLHALPEGMMLAVPTLLFALAIAAALGSALSNVVLAVGIASVPRFTRFVRGCVISARENVYVEAARAGGCSETRVAVRHILPNIYGPALILGTLNVGVAILTAATLSFLGMGAQPPTPEWGLVLAQGRDYLQNAWWVSTFPGVAIALTVLAVNLFGDGLHDALDPRLRL